MIEIDWLHLPISREKSSDNEENTKTGLNLDDLQAEDRYALYLVYKILATLLGENLKGLKWL